MANSINDTSPNLRDFLLNRNLILSDTVTNNGLSAVAIGLGGIANISTSDDAVQPSENIEDSGVNFRKDVISRNRYTSTEDMVAATIINNSYSYSQRDGGYIDENNQLNLGGYGTKGLDVLDSIFSQEGFGLGNGGFTAQGDIRTTLAGRVLGATGGINETPLGIIGGQQLLLALGQRATFNAQRELFGQVNLQPFSLLSGSDFIVPDNSITVRSTTTGRIGDLALDITGFNLPIDVIDDNASIFTNSVENSMGEASLLRNNSLIKYTGKGQLLRLFDNLNENQYKPAYSSDGAGRTKLGVSDPNEYDSNPDDIGLVNINDDNSQVYGIAGTKFIWDQDYAGGESLQITNKSDSLLQKTRNLFKDNDEFQLIKTALGNTPTYISNADELTTKMGKGWNMMSKGSGVINGKLLNGESLDDANPLDRIACRTWTSRIAYDNVSSLQKNSGLYNYGNRIRNDIQDSVLGDNGFVKISPYKVPDTGTVDPYEAKKFMFSIENLAWADDDSLANLPKYEIGNGDPKTGTKGRIMWFPPYDIKFTDTTAVSWDSTNFIGRGEPVYTYSNTERSGTLAFKVIIDYPDYMNDSKITTNELMASLAAGCMDYNKYFSQNEITKISQESNADTVLGQNVPVSAPNLPEPLNFYFPNDVASIPVNYEVPGTSLVNPTISEGYTSTVGTTTPNTMDYGLNADWNDITYINSLIDLFTQNKGVKVKINGYASKAGNSAANLRLSDARIASVKEWFTTNISSDIKFIKGDSRGDADSVSAENAVKDGETAKKDRRATAIFIYDGSTDEQINDAVDIQKQKSNTEKEILSNIKKRFHREDEYFEKLKNSGVESDKFIYSSFREKIKFFHPAFHSTTPEGFNSRLTFLQQCTRQGPTNKNNKSNNLAFGAPPICILRIGDFYHTKIVINSLDIQYEPLVWDLNPEGVGVQPMIANVTIAFKFIGGSALNGPINKLQNAVSFNYFANSGVYDPRADRWVRKDKIDPKDGFLFDPVDGVTNLQSILDDNENNPTQKTVPESSVRNDQKKVSEKSLENQVEVTYDDKSEIGNILIFGAAYTAGDDYVTIDLRYSHKGNSIYSLENTHVGNVYLTSLKDNNLKLLLGKIKASPNSSTTFIVSDNSGLQEQIISDGSGYISFSIDLWDFSDDMVTSITNVVNQGGGILKLEWPSIGVKSSTGF